MIKYLIGALSAISLLASGGIANAGSSNGVVSTLLAHKGDVAMFAIGVPENHQGRPPCSSVQWALNLSTESGKAQFATLLSAKLANKTVSVVGTNACGAWPDREEPLFIILQD